MAETGFIRRHSKPLLAVAAILIITGGIFMLSMFGKSKEERRNREYEVSLVKALKNSYEGIEEIRITDPEYTSPPGSWSCDVEITFNDGQKILYGINHNPDEEVNYGGRQKTREDWQYLEEHKGETTSGVKVVYSDNEEAKL